MKWYNIGEVAKQSGISKRTLHHYHDIGLLVPSSISEAGYRRYSSQDLLRLQQILLFKQCGVPLEEIKPLLVDSNEAHIELLQYQQQRLQQQILDSQLQLATLEKTIQRLRGDDMAIEDFDLYQGFGDRAEEIRDQATQKWGDEVSKMEQKIKQGGKAKWQAQQQEGVNIAKAVSELLHVDASDAVMQQLAERQLHWLQGFYEVSKERYLGLADLYQQSPEMRDFYDRHGDKTAAHLGEAMRHYAATHDWAN